eukprot:GHVH01004411.1.p1 GENE.GHVH01004411.1~~GHVH01004411.1.p1  ORF type:complete len:571 (-),score=79.58 GHVH01004411.1:134-1846(-)
MPQAPWELSREDDSNQLPIFEGNALMPIPMSEQFQPIYPEALPRRPSTLEDNHYHSQIYRTDSMNGRYTRWQREPFSQQFPPCPQLLPYQVGLLPHDPEQWKDIYKSNPIGRSPNEMTMNLLRKRNRFMTPLQYHTSTWGDVLVEDSSRSSMPLLTDSSMIRGRPAMNYHSSDLMGSTEGYNFFQQSKYDGLSYPDDQNLRDVQMEYYNRSGQRQSIESMNEMMIPRSVGGRMRMPQPRLKRASKAKNPVFHTDENMVNRGYYIKFLFNKSVAIELTGYGGDQLKKMMVTFGIEFALADIFLEAGGDRWCVMTTANKAVLIQGVVFLVHFCRRTFSKKRKNVDKKANQKDKTNYSRTTFKFLFDNSVDTNGVVTKELSKTSEVLEKISKIDEAKLDQMPAARSSIVSQNISDYNEILMHIGDRLSAIASNSKELTLADGPIDDPHLRIFVTPTHLDYSICGIVSAVKADPTTALGLIYKVVSCIIDANRNSKLQPVGSLIELHTRVSLSPMSCESTVTSSPLNDPAVNPFCPSDRFTLESSSQNNPDDSFERKSEPVLRPGREESMIKGA